MNISLYDSLYIRQNCILSFRNVSIDSLKDRFIHLYIYISKKHSNSLLFNTNIIIIWKEELIARSIIEAWTREANRFLPFVIMWNNEERKKEKQKERGRVAYSPLYTYIEKFQRLCSDPGNWSASIHDRDWCGECNFLGRRVYPPMHLFRARFSEPRRTRAFVLIRGIGGGDSEREFFGVRMLSWRKCAGNPIIHPERNRRIFDIDSAVRKTFFSRGGKQQQGGGRNNTELKWKRGKRSTFRIYGKWRFETIVWLSLRAMNIIGLLN